MAGIATERRRASTDAAHGKRAAGRYVLGELLGRGGMAEVFAGHAVGDHGFQKPVAIKRLLPELANDEVFVERLIEEAKLLVGMQHGHIVSVLDLVREGDDVFLVMEFVDGPSLRQLIKARGARGLSVGVASYIVQSAAAGLEFAHARPGGAIIHADISPSNLLLTSSGEVRVADFGIARREGLGHGVVEGKWAYMAPEQARGEPLAPRSDVFALGVVLYELLTGRHPFGSAVTASERDDQMQVIPPRVIKPSVPHGIDAICMRALAHEPRDRYGRMQQLIDALVEERFANGYREGAADLANAIREAAPGPDTGPSRTMHTDRPVTILTRSLLREVTPARSLPVRPSHPVGPLDPPPPGEFPMLPTAGVMTTARLADEPGSQVSSDEFVPVPSSAAHTMARFVDQIALAEAANAAEAMFQVPGGLRADGAPMPPFRLSDAALPGDELASVVGGHTFSGGPGLAVESRIPRWTVGVLVAAALIGVGAAVVIQSGPERRVAAVSAPTGAVEARRAAPPVDEHREAMAGEPGGRVALVVAPPVALPPVQPTIPDVPAHVDEHGDDGHDPAADLARPEAVPAVDPARPAGEPPAPDASERRPAATDPAPSRAPTKPRAARPGSKTAGKDARRTVEPGILSVQSSPWSWVTIGNQKKETPDKFYLAPGTYVVKFYSQDTGVTKYEPVTIDAGEMQKLNVEMRQ